MNEARKQFLERNKIPEDGFIANYCLPPENQEEIFDKAFENAMERIRKGESIFSQRRKNLKEDDFER